MNTPTMKKALATASAFFTWNNSFLKRYGILTEQRNSHLKPEFKQKSLYKQGQRGCEGTVRFACKIVQRKKIVKAQ